MTDEDDLNHGGGASTPPGRGLPRAAGPRTAGGPPAAPACVELWRIELDPPPARLRALEALLDEAERARAARYLVPHAGRRFLAARGSLRELLGARLGIRPERLAFAYEAHGKPWLPGHPELRFNLSHSHERALVAISPGAEVGVDLEQVRADLGHRALAERYFSEEERARLRGVPEAGLPQAFFEIWTRKEAVLKACGAGLTLSLKAFSVPSGALERPAPVRWSPVGPAPEEGWQVQGVEADPGYLGAVCRSGGGWRASPARAWPPPEPPGP